jgi:hypothetical protein
MSRTAFLSIAAAEMNLGDVFIRRAITRLIAANGHGAVIYTGAMGASYVGAFELPESWVVTSSPRVFLTALMRSCLLRRALVIMAPAPAQLDVAVVKRVGVAILLVLTRLSGNRVAVMGRALRGSGTVALAAERTIARVSALCLARDPLTAGFIGPPAEFKPDLGFAGIAPRYAPAAVPNTDRTIVALSLRFDHAPSADAVGAFVERLKTAGYDCVLVTQVREDRDVHERLARQCGIAHVDWPQTRSHLEQEGMVVDTYRRCVAVVSNRLHALVIGGRYGAVPVIADRVADNKLHPTLDDLLSLQSVWLHGDIGTPDNEVDLSESEIARTQVAFVDAAALLEPALRRFTELLDGNGS